MGFNDIDIKVSGGSDIISTLQTYTTRILKPNIFDGKNVLTQEMLSSKNTKYVIKYVYELLGTTLTMPQNVILEFDGGSIKNGTLVGNNTLMLNTNETESVLDNVTLGGTWKESSYDLVEEVVADKAPGDGMGRIILRKDKTFAEQLTQEDTIYVIRYDFELSEDVTIPANCVLQFEGCNLNFSNYKLYLSKNVEVIGKNTVFTCSSANAINVGYKNKIRGIDIVFSGSLSMDESVISINNRWFHNIDITEESNLWEQYNIKIDLQNVSIYSNDTSQNNIKDGNAIGIYGYIESGLLNGCSEFFFKDIIINGWFGNAFKVFCEENGNSKYWITNCRFEDICIDRAVTGFTFRCNRSCGYFNLDHVSLQRRANWTKYFIDCDKIVGLNVTFGRNWDWIQHEGETDFKSPLKITTNCDDVFIYGYAFSNKYELVNNTGKDNIWGYPGIHIEQQELFPRTIASVLPTSERLPGNTCYTINQIKSLPEGTYVFRSSEEVRAFGFTSYFPSDFSSRHGVVTVKHVQSAWNEVDEATPYVTNISIVLLETSVKIYASLNINEFLSEDRQIQLNDWYVISRSNSINLTDALPRNDGDVYTLKQLYDLPEGNYVISSYYDCRALGLIVAGMQVLSDAVISVSKSKLRCWLNLKAEPYKGNDISLQAMILSPNATDIITNKSWYRQDGTVIGMLKSGTWAQKPELGNKYVGYRYFCTDKQTTEGATNGIEIIHKGNDVWVDALGRVVS